MKRKSVKPMVAKKPSPSLAEMKAKKGGVSKSNKAQFMSNLC
jgi:hypothetical protein